MLVGGGGGLQICGRALLQAAVTLDPARQGTGQSADLPGFEVGPPQTAGGRELPKRIRN